MARRLIDADAFQEDLENRYCFPCMGAGKDRRGTACCACWVHDMVSEIEDAEKIDAVPVIRCRDCKHHRIFLKRDMCARYAQILNGHEVGVCATREDDFCSYGERKEGGEDD